MFVDCHCVSELERIADAEVKRLQSLVVMQQIVTHQHSLCFDAVSQHTTTAKPRCHCVCGGYMC